jgi:hypothetical protein
MSIANDVSRGCCMDCQKVMVRGLVRSLNAYGHKCDRACVEGVVAYCHSSHSKKPWQKWRMGCCDWHSLKVSAINYYMSLFLRYVNATASMAAWLMVMLYPCSFRIVLPEQL